MAGSERISGLAIFSEVKLQSSNTLGQPIMSPLWHIS